MPENLAAQLKAHARDALGFDLVGITTADPLPGGARLAGWVGAGRHGDMAYMADTAAVRGDPRRFLPGAASVVCVAMSYHGAADAAPADRVEIARYARRRDYHKVIRPRLVRLGRWLAERVPGASWRPAVDTAPLLEKELAQRAGLGWIGKNTCLINRDLGSELLLGELATDVPLPPDEPETDHCGTCRACLDACPTAAFDGPRRLDARRCISYATIEHRGAAIPAEVDGGLGKRLFGCDVCQAVCPWNRRAAPSCNPAMPARAHLAAPTGAELERLDAEGWARFSAGTPLRRLDFRRFRRNLAAVAGRPGTPGR